MSKSIIEAYPTKFDIERNKDGEAVSIRTACDDGYKGPSVKVKQISPVLFKVIK